VVSDAVVINVLIDLLLTGELLSNFEGFPDGAGVSTTTTDIVDLGNAWCLEKLLDEASHVMGVDVVADLFAFITKDTVFPAFEVALDQVGKKSVQLNTGVVWPSQATAT